MAENNIKFEELKREMPYKWRVQSFSKYKPEATCVAYVDSRDVQKLLDEVVGPENWQDEYYAVKNNLFCKIGIRVNGEWTWKGDCGTESNVDKEKGEASDAFKRAAVKWGPGRFLYDLGMFKVKTDKKLGESQGNPMPLDDAGNKIWDLTKHINGLIAAQKKTKGTQKPAPEKVATAKAAMEVSKPEVKAATTEQQELYKELLQDEVWTDEQRVNGLEKLPLLDFNGIAQAIGKMQKHIEKAKTAAA